MCVQPSWQTISSRCQWVFYRTRAFVHSGTKKKQTCGTSTTEALNWPIKNELTSITVRAIWKSLNVVFLCLFGLQKVVNCVLWKSLQHLNFLGLGEGGGCWGLRLLRSRLSRGFTVQDPEQTKHGSKGRCQNTLSKVLNPQSLISGPITSWGHIQHGPCSSTLLMTPKWI